MLHRLLVVAAAGAALSAAVDRPTAVKMAIEIASRELNVQPPTIHVVRVEPVEWRDSSLGCPRKGMAYRHELTPGYKVTLAFDGDTAVVHVTDGRAVVCSHIPASKVSSKPLALAAVKVMALARAHLAARLDVAERDISVNVARPATWPNASLGCPVEGQTHGETPVPGFVIELRYEKRLYRYHSDMTSRVVFCDE